MRVRNLGSDLDLQSLLRGSMDQSNFTTERVVLMDRLLTASLQSPTFHSDLSSSIDMGICAQGIQRNMEQEVQKAFQIFIKSPSGKSFLLWVQAIEGIIQLKKNILHILGIPTLSQSLIYKGKLMHDDLRIHDYNIAPSSTIILNLGLRGGSSGL